MKYLKKFFELVDYDYISDYDEIYNEKEYPSLYLYRHLYHDHELTHIQDKSIPYKKFK